MLTKQQIIDALRAFAEQRPGIEPGNYGSWRDYRNESASVTRDLHDARALIRACEWRDSVTAERMLKGFRAFSGRLSISETDNGEARIDYCTGQYFPTEFRKAVAAVCASALWDYWRDECMPSAIVHEDGSKTYPHCRGGKNEQSAGDWLRSSLRWEFGNRLASRYFN